MSFINMIKSLKKKRSKNKKSSSAVLQNTRIGQKGDTLYSISKLYNTTVDAIKKQNNLRFNRINYWSTTYHFFKLIS